MATDFSRVCTLVPSPYDHRDWKYEARVSAAVDDLIIPKKFLCKDLPPVKNQASRGTCVAFALSAMKEYQEYVDNPDLKGYLFSPNSIYIYRTTTSGMVCRDAMKSLKEHGMCGEEFFPYSSFEPKIISKDAVLQAKNYVIKSYAQITSIDGAKKALIEYGPLLIAFPYYNNGKPEFWIKPTLDAKVEGGHGVAVVGWDEKGFIIRNSWGAGWNGNGHVVYPFDQWGAHWELWTSIDEETNYIPDSVKNRSQRKCCF